MTILDEMANNATREMMTRKITNLEVDDISRNELNTAPMNEEYLKALETLVQENGVLDPVVVYKVSNNNYKLLGGERRWIVSKRLKQETIPAIIVEKPTNEINEIKLIELLNVKRPDDEETMRHKVNRLKEVYDHLRKSNDPSTKGLRATEWIAENLSGISARTVQEYLTGKYSGKGHSMVSDELNSQTSKVIKETKLSSLSKKMDGLVKLITKQALIEFNPTYQDLNECEQSCSQLIDTLNETISDIEVLKKEIINRNESHQNNE